MLTLNHALVIFVVIVETEQSLTICPMASQPAVQRSKRMDFRLTDEQKMVQQTVRDFVNRELMPLEGDVLRNEREGRPGIEREQLRELQQKAKEIGFWGINTPEEYGGANLGPIMTAITSMELTHTFVPFTFGGS